MQDAMRPLLRLRNRILPVGIATLLTIGLLLSGCAPKEATPPHTPITAPDEEGIAAVSPDQGTEDETSSRSTIVLPEPTTPKPRPSTPFVSNVQAKLFEDDFQDGTADGWMFELGWDVSLENGNYVLTGCGHSFARPDVSGWTDYTI